jgi:hypothetical protein
MTERKIVTVLEPDDEYTHEPDPVANYNESMYLNGFDLERGVGAWFRLGNRVNEGYAEMTVCIYLPGGRVGFMYARPEITTNDEMNAGGLEVAVLTPFEHLQITYEGRVLLLDDPLAMANPRAAFSDNPYVDCRVHLDVRGVSPMFGGLPRYDDGSPVESDPEKSFAKAHYEQHTAVTGTIEVGGEIIEMDGYGLRDKSWGPRYWQAINWYRWLPMSFGDDFGMMLSIVNVDGTSRRSGMVLVDGEYQRIRDCRIESDWDDNHYQTAMRCWVRTDEREYEVTGEVLSMIPLRNRRTTPDGEQLHTRITEAMTRYECDGRIGVGMSEYLDQIVDGTPVGDDVVS